MKKRPQSSVKKRGAITTQERLREVAVFKSMLRTAYTIQGEMIAMLRRCLLEQRSVGTTWSGSKGTLTYDLQELLLRAGLGEAESSKQIRQILLGSAR